MSLGFDFHPEARVEFLAEVDWYDAREASAGDRFEVAVRDAINAAIDSPGSWSVWPGCDGEPEIRSTGVNGFPYRVVYFVTDEILTIVAVAHSRQRPGYWRERLPSA